MISYIKKILYFPIANYFRFFAKIQLARWKPRVIVVTGSSGKTTTLNLIHSQLGYIAKYSEHANSAYGIPFNILGLERKTLTFDEWFYLFLMAPFGIFKTPPKEKMYVVETDCDRPAEGNFLATLLKPEVVVWLSSTKTHSMNFPQPVEESIAYEFGYFVEYAKKLVIVNSDSKLITAQLRRTNVKIEKIKKEKFLKKYIISSKGTEFQINRKKFVFNNLLPEDTFYSITACLALTNYLDAKPDYSFSKFILPPGRSSKFKGIKNTIIIDSTYNANLSSVSVILDMFAKLPAREKWAVLGDMLEQGSEEKAEHEKLAELIATYDFKRVILMGPRVYENTYPNLKALVGDKVIVRRFTRPIEVLDYLKKNIKGGETILFKGARFLEGVIEHLLEDKSDADKLARREKIWQIRRKKWGL